MSKYELTIAYDGNALQDGTMDVRELAPALLAFGNLIEEANKELNGPDSKMQVLVKTDFKAGSFHVDFEIVRTLAEQVSSLFNFARHHLSVEEILNYLGLVAGISGFTLLELFRKIANRKIKRGTVIENNNVRLEFEDDSETIDIDRNVYQLFINLKVLAAIQDILKPLGKDGIERFFTQKEGRIQKEIAKSEVPYYRIPEVTKVEPQEEKIIESTSKAAYKIVTASFEEGYKWRLTNYGQDKITAILKDQAFINQIANNEVSLSKEDVLIVEIKTTQWHIQGGGIRTENEITKVLEHKKMPTQLAIPFFDDKEE